MSEVLNGNATNVTTPLVATVTAFADNGGGEIRVTTSAPHYFGNNDTVHVYTALLDWTYTITVIDATHFDLVGSVYTSTSTGTAVDLSLTPQVQVPTDGDTQSLQISGMLSAQQAMLDRDQYLNQQLLDLVISQYVTAEVFNFTGNLGNSTILSVTSKGPPAELQTSAPHNLQSGMTVQITGAVGDTAINGTWFVIVINATHFTIPVMGSGSYSASSATVTPVIPNGVTAVIVDGWGAGGGGEGGGGQEETTDDSSAFIGTVINGGGGAGAHRTTAILPVVPGSSIAITQGIGGLGGAGATASVTARAGLGGTSTNIVIGSSEIFLAGGNGAGSDQVNVISPYLGDAIIAPGGHGESNAIQFRPWPQILGIPAVAAVFQFTATANNLSNYVQGDPGDGGAAVVVYQSGTMPNPSMYGWAQGPYVGGSPGSKGTNSGSSPVYLGGSGGGGGGAGPGGDGGTGGDGSNANHTGNSTNASDAPSGFATGGTGAGGGGGGNAGAASGTVAHGGAGATGDTGQCTLYFVSQGSSFNP